MSSQLLFLSVCYGLAVMAKGNILVYRAMSNQFLQEFYDIPAQFGPSLPPNGLRVRAIRPSDNFGCGPLKPPPAVEAKYAIILQRGGVNCSFELKVRNAQAAKYDAVIVYNIVNDDDLESMSAKNGTGINIPAVFVAYSTGVDILAAYTDDTSILVINDDLPFNINTQLILPFSILIGLCFLIMIFYMIYKCVREERRLRQNRLPTNMLKKIKITKFTKGQPYEVCVICLDEFVEGDKLRVLPCAHAYHSICIDPWLTKNKRVCPICKRKVFAKGETRSSRRRPSSLDSTTDTDDETTALLRTAVPVPYNYYAILTNSQGEESSAAAAAGDGDGDNDNQTDDENVLLTNESSNSSSLRVNPFDRQAADMTSLLENRRSIWDYPILRLIRRRPQQPISITAPPMIARGGSVPRSRFARVNAPVNVPESASGAAAVATTTAVATGNGSPPTSNNILNPNLSGSFKDDDEMEPHQTIYEPIATETPSAAASTTDLLGIIIEGQTQTDQQQQDSVFIQTPSQGGIGVVALPNTNLRNPHLNSSQLPPNRQYFI